MGARELDVIYDHGRTKAIEEGALVDVSRAAPELVQNAGFTVPVAMTAATWEEFVDVPEGVVGQDWKYRLWDVVWMLSGAIRAARDSGSTQSALYFHVFVRNDNKRPKLVRLRAVCSRGDDGRPCITILKSKEN